MVSYSAAFGLENVIVMSQPGKKIEAPSWKGPLFATKHKTYETQHADMLKRIEAAGERFGQRLRDLRVSRGMTQIQLSDYAHLDRSYISDMERGVKEPALGTLVKLSITFNLTLAQLMEGV